jgi:hypothetical protein
MGSQASGQKEKDKLGVALGSAMKLKNLYHAVLGSTASLVDTIQRNPQWSWAHNESNLGKLDAMRLKVTDHVHGDQFASTFLFSDIKDVRGTFGAEHLLVEVGRFLEMEPMVLDLRKYYQRVLAMHAANSKF